MRINTVNAFPNGMRIPSDHATSAPGLELCFGCSPSSWYASTRSPFWAQVDPALSSSNFKDQGLDSPRSALSAPTTTAQNEASKMPAAKWIKVKAL